MELDYISSAFALVLLWLPVYLFISSRMRRRLLKTDEEIKNAFPLGRLALVWQNWVDLVRGGAGAWILYNVSFTIDPELEGSELYTYAIIAAVLFLGVVFQVLYYRRKWYCYCPFFYLIGVSFGVLDWWIALYGLLVGLFVGGLTNRAIVFLGVMAATIGVSGFLIEGLQPEWPIVCVLMLLPFILSLIVRRDLTPLVRKQSSSDQ